MNEPAKKQIYKPRPVTGFPEWLPEVRLVEQRWFDHIRKVFESYGYCSIETPSVEELDVLRAKGEVDKEIYVIERLHKDENEKGEARLALHFDQTVPLARYVAQNFNDLTFPFKRYQMQRVWRGERPQAGRFREFYQCDIDVIGVDSLPLHFDAEMPAVMYELIKGLPGMENERFQIRISNRKILDGFLQAQDFSSHIGAPEILSVVRGAIDKIEKIGRSSTLALIEDYLSAKHFKQEDIVAKCNAVERFLDFAEHKYTNSGEFLEGINQLKKGNPKLISTDLFHYGTTELTEILDNLSHLPPGSVVADLSIVRGLDYYTGTVYETKLLDAPEFGSICSGGRYDDLAGSYINKHLPGVGISIGFSRLFAYLHEKKKLPVGPVSAAHVLMVLPSEEKRAEAADTARALRARGLNVELYHAAKKIPDQLKYASKKGIPYVWFPPFDETGRHEVKNMRTQEQKPADPQKWIPDEQ